MQNKFHLFGLTHWAILGAMAIIAAILIFSARKYPKTTLWIHCTLAAVLILNKLITLYVAWSLGVLTWQEGLPMHLCDWATFITIVILFWRNQLLYEIAYYWGLSGTVQAVLTPEINVSLADPRFYTFFVSHCGIIIAVFYLTIGLKMQPSRFSVWKVFGFTQFYLIVTMLLDWLIGANYGYFFAKPQGPSLLDYMGPWPWYILSEEVLILIFFGLCYAPFAFLEAKKQKK